MIFLESMASAISDESELYKRVKRFTGKQGHSEKPGVLFDDMMNDDVSLRHTKGFKFGIQFSHSRINNS